MGKITREMRAVPAKEPARPIMERLGRLFRRKKVEPPQPKKMEGEGAQVIPFDPKRRGKGNAFKPRLGKGNGMVETISEEELGLKRIKRNIEKMEEAGEEVPQWLKDAPKEIEARMKGKVRKEYSKEEVLEALKKNPAKDFDAVEGLLEIPVKTLYMVVEGRGFAYSEKEGESSNYMRSLLRQYNAELPRAEETAFSIGFVDSTSQTYFVLCDPVRRIVLVESLLYEGEGSWKDVAYSLGQALEYKKAADRKKEKYNFIVANMGSVSVQ
jgi:hypothetical protein